MSRLAILNPDSLVGIELKEQLERRRSLWRQLDLLTLETADYATLAEVAGEPALVQSLDPDSLAGTDILFVCPLEDQEPAELMSLVATAGTVIFVSPTGPVPAGRPVVAGVNLTGVTVGCVLVSPHPACVALANLLHPLAALGLSEATAVVLQPASAHGQDGLDEFLEQIRVLLAFSNEYPQETLGRRLALNLYPVPSPGALTESVAKLLATEVTLSIELLQAGVFHAVSASVRVCCAPETTSERLREALAAHPAIDLRSPDQPPGPADVAGADRLVVGRTAPDPARPGAFWLWAVGDNLTFGGASNALAVAEALLERPN